MAVSPAFHTSSLSNTNPMRISRSPTRQKKPPARTLGDAPSGVGACISASLGGGCEGEGAADQERPQQPEEEHRHQHRQQHQQDIHWVSALFLMFHTVTTASRSKINDLQG